MTVVVTADRGEERFISVKPRIHWVNLNSLKILDVLPRGLAQVEADYGVVGLRTGSDGDESGRVIGQNAGAPVCRPSLQRQQQIRQDAACATGFKLPFRFAVSHSMNTLIMIRTRPTDSSICSR